MTSGCGTAGRVTCAVQSKLRELAQGDPEDERDRMVATLRLRRLAGQLIVASQAPWNEVLSAWWHALRALPEAETTPRSAKNATSADKGEGLSETPLRH